MKHVFSFAMVLHRPFDSAPPESTPEFKMDRFALNPFHKLGGIYVFINQPPGKIFIRCPGYQDAEADIQAGQVKHICLYPEEKYDPPAGWLAKTVEYRPKSICWIRDLSCEIRLSAFDREKSAVQLYAHPGFVGGCLLFSRDKAQEIALILEKQPPNHYFLSELKNDYTNAIVSKVYPGKADKNGKCRLVFPQGTNSSEQLEKEGFLSDKQL